MHIRKEIRSFKPEELLGLRRAMMELQNKVTEPNFIGLAGLHGIPESHCPHGSPLFLPWHRVYIRAFEQALQSIDSSVSLPFWDWTSTESIAQGMAPAHMDQTFNDGGVNLPNSLASGPIEDRSRRTRRAPPQNPGRLGSFASSVELAMDRDSYLEFNNWLEGPHGSVHVWIGGAGGDMASVPRAAYDPIFWSHHATVDRQWAVWQKCNPERSPPDDLLPQTLPGFSEWTVGDTLEISSSRLDYSYEGLDALVCPVPMRPRADGVVPFGVLENAARVRKPRIVVEINDVARDGESFMVDVFVRDNNEKDVFAGSFGILGADGLHQRGDDFPHSLKTTQHIDVTDTIDKLDIRDKPVELRLKAINKFGEEIDPSVLPIGSLDIKLVP